MNGGMYSNLTTALLGLRVAADGPQALSVHLRPEQVTAVVAYMDEARARLDRVREVLSEQAPNLGHPQMDADLYARWENVRIQRARTALGAAETLEGCELGATAPEWTSCVGRKWPLVADLGQFRAHVHSDGHWTLLAWEGRAFLCEGNAKDLTAAQIECARRMRLLAAAVKP